MNAKKTIGWLALAAVLFSFIYFYQRHRHPPLDGPVKVLPELRPELVTSVQIRPSGPAQLQIRADRTNGVWRLSQPLSYPAQADRVQKLLELLQKLDAAQYISGSELRMHPNADEDYGFASPQATLVIQQGAYVPRLRVGALTNPGDQVFLQVEGDLGAYVVDAELLRFLPGSANDWRDTTLVNLDPLNFDRLAITNNPKGDVSRAGLPSSSSTLVLQRDQTNRLWRMAWPLDARANHPWIEEALRKLRHIRIREFVSDDPKADLEPLGLSPAELELGFARGTNGLALLQFGRCPTNDTSRIYARRAGAPGVFTVDKDLLLDWCALLNDFRDPHLVSSSLPINSIDVTHGDDRSSLERRPDNTWKISPGDFSADESLMAALLSSLTNLPVAKFVNDVVSPADLPGYGLAPPLMRLVLTLVATASSTSTTNTLALDFGVGTNAQDKVFAKRSDESVVYAILTNDFTRLPSATWSLRDRVLCHFSKDDVASVTLRCHGKVCQMIHKGPLSWSFAPGSQGIINDGAIEETIRGVVQASAIVWVARGEESRKTYGFVDAGYHLAMDLKNGEKFDIEFGGQAPSGNIYAAVVLEGQPWIMEYPWLLYRDVATYLPLSPDR
jgi:hypothetical protein